MKIYLQTPVKGSVPEVFSKFNKDLFVTLKPPLVNVELVKFDGCRRGDEFHLLIRPVVGTQEWKGKVTEDYLSDSESYFIDEGVQLPFPLSKWRHKHLIKKIDAQTFIIDDIEFETSPKFLGPLVYPFLLAMFKFRVPIYQRIFS